MSELLVLTNTEASNLSQHLSVLRRAGVVAARREGNAGARGDDDSRAADAS